MLADRGIYEKGCVIPNFFFAFGLANAVDANVPSDFSIITFAISKYEYDWQKELPVATDAANALVNSFRDNLKEKYSNTVTFSSKQYENDQVTRSRFKGTETDNYNFVFYNGHGNVNKITMWPQNERIWHKNNISDKNFGGKTYWALINSCLVFKNGEADQDSWFNGIHSILGFSSKSFWFSKSYSCGFLYLSTCHRYSYYTERDFAYNWISGKQGIAMAFFNAVYKNIYKEGGYGVEPKIVYRYGYVDGKFFDPWEETFEKIDSIYIGGNTISIPYQIYCDKDNMKSVGVYIHGDTLNIALIEKEKTPNFSIDCPVWIYGTLKSNIKGNYIETPFNVYPLGKK